jgi:hypothetical protein
MWKVWLELFAFLKGNASVLDGVKEHPHPLLLQIFFRYLKKNFRDSSFQTTLA